MQLLDFCSWNSLYHHDLTSLMMTISAVYGFGIPWVLNKIWRYLECACNVIFPSSYSISLKLRRPLGHENINGEKGVQSQFVAIQAVICLPELWDVCPLLCGTLTSSSGGRAAESSAGSASLGLCSPGLEPVPDISCCVSLHFPQVQPCFQLLPWFYFLWTIPEVSCQCVTRRSQRDMIVQVWQLLLAFLS